MARWMTKALAVTPGVLIRTVLTCMIGAVLPAPAALVLFIGGLLTGVVLSTGAAEPAAAKLLVFSRPATPVELSCLAGALTLLCRVGLGPPVVRLRVRAGEKAIAAGGFGRHTVVISSGLLEAVEDGSLPPEQAAAVIAHAAGLVRGGSLRQDPVLAFWTLPWQLLRALGQVLASAGGLVIACGVCGLLLPSGPIHAGQGLRVGVLSLDELVFCVWLRSRVGVHVHGAPFGQADHSPRCACWASVRARSYSRARVPAPAGQNGRAAPCRSRASWTSRPSWTR
jgi:hypothetical protein